ncbi:MAG TPA: copper resistance system multicopper oxidase [Burkholderiales bacterium]
MSHWFAHRGARRRFLQCTAALGLLQAFRGLAPAYAQGVPGPGAELRVGGGRVADLVIARTPFSFGGHRGSAITVNGTLPGPILRFREGETATLRVANRLDEDTSIHWHGILVPSGMDGVPGLSFPGIRPGETFTYRFPVRQSGTYWYHSHSSLQEQLGHYGPLVMEPAHHDPVRYDREHFVVLSDWTFRDPHRVLAMLKKRSGVFNFQQRTLGDFFREAKANGFRDVWQERKMWGEMRMSPTDILDVTGAVYTYLVNGLPPDGNWTALYRPGERVRLRIINASAGTFFNVRIPGLRMTVVAADGQNVRPVTVDEFQIAIAETYDVIVEPKADAAYTIFAEAMDRSGYARGTLAPRPGMAAAVPALRERALRTMLDMGMDHGGGEHGHNGHAGAGQTSHEHMHRDHGGGTPKEAPPKESPTVARHGPDTHGPENQMVAEIQRNRLGEPGTGLENVGHRVLVYTDLEALEPSFDPRPPEREIEFHLTGNMEAFVWGMDGRKFSDSGAQPKLRVGERVRFTLVNDTMMEHPMHLHGVFLEIVNGAGRARQPRKHTINVKPAERLSFDFTFDEPGNFAFHCHVLYHMEMGMFRFVNVSGRALRRPA